MRDILLVDLAVGGLGPSHCLEKYNFWKGLIAVPNLLKSRELLPSAMSRGLSRRNVSHSVWNLLLPGPWNDSSTDTLLTCVPVGW